MYSALGLAAALTLTACGGNSGTTPAPAATGFNTAGYLAGNASPSYPAGAEGEIDVVHIGAVDVDSNSLYFAFRNNTAEAVSLVNWSVTATVDGQEVSTGASRSNTPAVVEPGDVGLSYITFEDVSGFNDNVEFDFDVSFTPASERKLASAVLTVDEANLVEGEVVGTFTNTLGQTIDDMITVEVYCFDGDNIIGSHSGYSDQSGDFADGESSTFSIGLFGSSCDTFVAGANGWF